MNKTYKSIFNESTGTYVAVGETAKSKTKGAALIASLLLGASSLSAQAIPATTAIADYGLMDNGSVQTAVGGLPTGTAESNAVEIGNKAQALAIGSIALGSSARACPSGGDPNGDGILECTNTIAIGSNSTADNDKSAAFGSASQAIGTGSTAIGANSAASGSWSTALGVNSKADAANATALGGNSKASGLFSTAVGSHSNASGRESTALGTYSKASSNFSTAVGVNSDASGFSSTALGDTAKASGRRAIAGGYSATASGDNSVSIGNQAQATGTNSISIGTGNIVTGQSSGAIGDPTTINGTGTYTLGNDNGTIDANNSGVFGNDNTITGALKDVRVIGNTNKVTANGAMVMGNSATVSAADGVALGNNTNVAGASGIAIGTNAYVSPGTPFVSAANNIAIGTSASATASKNVAVGAFASVSGDESVAFGYSAIATGATAVAIGTLAKASSTSDTAIGYNAQASGSGSTALGQSAIASGLVSSAIGNKSVATGSFSSAFGDGASATERESLATGALSIASAGNTSVYGTRAEATKDGATAIGNRSKATGVNAVAIGVDTQASLANSVSLGANSLTDSNTVYSKTSTNNGIIFGDYAGTVNSNTGYVVSVGAIGRERQIKNVASGVVSSISTDAINGSQLYATDVALSNVASSTKNILGGNATLNPDGSITMTNIGDTGYNTVHEAIKASKSTKSTVVAGTNIASVDSVSDAGGTTYTVNAKGTTASAGSTAVTVVGTTDPTTNITDYKVDLSKATQDKLDGALQTVVTQIDGKDVKTINKTNNTANFVTGKNIKLSADSLGGIEVATADNVIFTDVTTTNLTATGVTNLGGTTNITGDTYYTGSIKDGNSIVNKTYVDNNITSLANNPLSFAGDTGSAITKKLGETLTISGKLAEGEDATGANLRVDSADGKLNLVMAKDLTDLNGITINGGPTINNQGITNLAAGEVSATSTDAVNGSQLYAVSQTANAGWNIATDSGAAAASNVKPSDTVNFNGDGNVVVSNAGNDVTVGLADKVTIGKGDAAVTIDGTKGTIQAGDVTINGDKGTVNGLSNTTWDANNIVKGQAATEDQLKVVADNVTAAVGAAKTEVEAGKNVFVSSKPGDNNQTVYTVATKDEVDFNKVTVGSLTIDKTNVDAAGNTIISGVGAGELSSTSTDAVNGSQLYATNQQVAKNTTDITNLNTNLDKGLNFSADSGTPVNRKLGDTVAITGDKNIITATTANGVQIKLSDNIDVKNVNVSQSITVAEGAKVDMGGNVIQNVGAGVNGTDAVNVNQVNAVAGNLNNRINRVGHIANAGVAQAIATAGLPQAYLPGKSMMAVAGGTYEGETGYAIGFSTISDNGKWIIKVTGSGNSRDKYGASLGAGYQW